MFLSTSFGSELFQVVGGDVKLGYFLTGGFVDIAHGDGCAFALDGGVARLGALLELAYKLRHLIIYNCFGIIFLGLVGWHLNLLDDFNGIGSWVVEYVASASACSSVTAFESSSITSWLGAAVESVTCVVESATLSLAELLALVVPLLLQLAMATAMIAKAKNAKCFIVYKNVLVNNFNCCYKTVVAVEVVIHLNVA